MSAEDLTWANARNTILSDSNGWITDGVSDTDGNLLPGLFYYEKYGDTTWLYFE